MENLLSWLIAIAILFFVISIIQLFVRDTAREMAQWQNSMLGVIMTGVPKLIGRSVNGGN